MNNGLLMPSTGFGTAGLGEQTDESVQEALLAGYTLFDTAQVSFYIDSLTDRAEPCLICHLLNEWVVHGSSSSKGQHVQHL